MTIETINNKTRLIADEGKVLRRIADELIVGDEITLGYTHYLNGVKLDDPKLETADDYEEIDAPQEEVPEAESEDDPDSGIALMSLTDDEEDNPDGGIATLSLEAEEEDNPDNGIALTSLDDVEDVEEVTQAESVSETAELGSLNNPIEYSKKIFFLKPNTYYKQNGTVYLCFKLALTALRANISEFIGKAVEVVQTS